VPSSQRTGKPGEAKARIEYSIVGDASLHVIWLSWLSAKVQLVIVGFELKKQLMPPQAPQTVALPANVQPLTVPPAHSVKCIPPELPALFRRKSQSVTVTWVEPKKSPAPMQTVPIPFSMKSQSVNTAPSEK
jgi:hypothetical protein